MDFHSTLNSKHKTAIARHCSKNGCTLHLSGLSPKPIVIDCDSYRTTTGCQGKICDFFLFPLGKQIVVIIVEMKRGSVDSSKAILQLRASSNEVSTVVGGTTVKEFYPLILAGDIGHASQLKALRGTKISFRGREYPIIFRRCGVHLRDILLHYGSCCLTTR